MTPETDNPYATPAVVDPSAPMPDGMWHVSDNILMVRNGAELPVLNFYGKSDEGLVLKTRTFRSIAKFFSWLPSLLVAFPYFLQKGLEWLAVDTLVAIGLSYAILIPISGMLVYFHRRFAQKAVVSFYVSRHRGRWRRKARWVGGVMAAIGLTLGAIAWPWHNLGSEFWTAFFLFQSGFLTLVFSSVDRINCSKYSDGWFHLSGVPKPVLRKLEAIANSPHAPTS